VAEQEKSSDEKPSRIVPLAALMASTGQEAVSSPFDIFGRRDVSRGFRDIRD